MHAEPGRNTLGSTIKAFIAKHSPEVRNLAVSSKMEVLLSGVLVIRALLFGVCIGAYIIYYMLCTIYSMSYVYVYICTHDIWAPEFWELPFAHDQ